MGRLELAEAERSLGLLAYDDVPKEANRKKHLQIIIDSMSSWMAYRALDFLHPILMNEGLRKFREKLFETVIQCASEDRADKGKDRNAVDKTLRLVKDIPEAFRRQLEEIQAEFEASAA